MLFNAITPQDLVWETRPHEDGEPARHVAELSDALGGGQVRANVWRYDPGAQGRRHVHAAQDETFIVMEGTLTMYLGEPPVCVEVPTGSVVTVSGGTPLQTVNAGLEDLVVYAYGYPPDEGAEVLYSAV